MNLLQAHDRAHRIGWKNELSLAVLERCKKLGQEGCIIGPEGIEHDDSEPFVSMRRDLQLCDIL
jgi:hypothetical protein